MQVATAYGLLSRTMAVTALWLLALGVTRAVELPTSGRDSAPFFKVKNGVASGICPDIYAALERIDPSLQIRGAERVRSLPLNLRDLAAGNESINCGLGRSPERDAYVRYVQLITTTHMVIAVRNDDAIDSVKNLDQLRVLTQDQPVIVRRGTVFADRLKRMGMRVDDSSADNADNLKKLLYQRGRFYYNIDYLMAEQLREPAFAGKIRVLPNTFEPQPVYLVVSNKQPTTIDASILAAFKVMRANGELDVIFKKNGLLVNP